LFKQKYNKINKQLQIIAIQLFTVIEKSVKEKTYRFAAGESKKNIEDNY
jgi:hypothetical protein